MTTAASLLDPNFQPPLTSREIWAQKITNFLSVPAYAEDKPLALCPEQQRLVNLAWHVKNRDVLIRAGRIMLSNGRAESLVWDLR